MEFAGQTRRIAATLSWALPMLLLVAAAIDYCLPLFAGTWFTSHEGYAYVVRALEFRHGWDAGVAYPRWAPDLYGGYGSPFFNYYAPLVFVAASAVEPFVHDAAWSLKVAVVAFSVLGACSAFGLVRAETRRNDAALVGAMLFVALPYRLSDLFVRGDLAEYSALCLLTAALFGYRSIALTPRPSRVYLIASLTALLHAATILCHTLTGFWGTKLIGLVLAVSGYRLLKLGDRRRLRALGFAFVASLVLSVTYWLPALLEKHLVPVERMIRPSGHPTNRWVFAHDLVNHPFTGMGWPFVLAAAIGVLVLFVRFARARSSALWWGVALLCMFLCLPEANAIWRSGLIPLSSFIQFPWRLLGLAGICGAVGSGIAWRALFARQRGWTELAAGGVALYLWSSGVPHAQVQGYYSRDQVPASAEALRSRIESGSGVDEYLPHGATLPKAPRPAALLETGPHVKLHSLTGDGYAYDLDLEASRPEGVHLALHWFPGWKVLTREGPQDASIEPRNGRVELHLPRPGRYHLQLTMGATATRATANTLSLVALLVLLPAAWFLLAMRHEMPA